MDNVQAVTTVGNNATATGTSIDTRPTLVTSSSSSSSKDILSERVQRALSIRTDTGAMKTAFDALQQTQKEHFHDDNGKSASTKATGDNQFGIIRTALASSHGSSGSSNSTSMATTTANTIDSRSVRTIMEYDTYQQAMLVQDSIESMLQMIQELRMNCTNVVETARMIRSTIHSSTVLGNNGDAPAPSSVGALVNTDVSEAVLSSKESDNASRGVHDREDQLASTLANAIQQRNTIALRIQTLQSFISQYHLSDQDIYLLEHYNFSSSAQSNTDNSNEEGMAFLRALQRIRKIRTALQREFGSGNSSGTGSTGSSEFLISSANTSTSNSSTATTAFHLMEQLSAQQEQAYERLYHWLQQYLQQQQSPSMNYSNDKGGNATRQSYTYSHEFILYAIQTLKFVPPFYNHCIELMSNQRRTIVTRNFLIALTVGSNNDANSGDMSTILSSSLTGGGDTGSYSDHVPQQPIEMKAHDSVAYVGDMLAFSFKSFTLEADLTKTLLTYQIQQSNDEEESKDDMNGDIGHGQGESSSSLMNQSSSDIYDTTSTEEKALSAIDMVSISMSGLVRPLKSRILQVVATLCRRNDDAVNVEGSNDSDTTNTNDGYYGTSDNMLDSEDDGSQIRTRVGQLYDICGLLLFYYATILRGIKKLAQHQQTESSSMTSNLPDPTGTSTREMNPLLDCILECLIEATQGYEATIRVYCAMVDQIALLTGDSIATLMQRLVVLVIQLRSHSPGYLEDITHDCPNPTCIETLSIEWVMEILITSCFNIRTITIDDIITIKELFYTTKRNMDVQFNYEKAIHLDAMIIEKEMTVMNELINTETMNVYDLCGLGTIVNGWNNYKEITSHSATTSSSVTDISSHPGLTVHEIETSIKEFYLSLYSPPIPSLEMVIDDPITRKQIRTKIANHVVSFYNELYNCIQNNASYSSIRHVFQHSPQEVQSLFTV